MANTNIGRIRPKARGTHSTSISYEVMDLVRNVDGTATYMAIKNVPTDIELTDTNYWVLFLNALEGPQGIQGEHGVSVTGAAVNEETGHLMVELSEGEPIDAGYVVGPEGPQGLPFTYNDFTPEQLEALRGPEGPQGQGITILGSYDSEDELLAAHPTGNAGDAYLVDGDLYVWSATEDVWKNVGTIKPEAGKDYWTEEEQEEIKDELKTYVDEQLVDLPPSVKITASTEDLIAGESPLAEGEVYLVYE